MTTITGCFSSVHYMKQFNFLKDCWFFNVLNWCEIHLTELFAHLPSSGLLHGIQQGSHTHTFSFASFEISRHDQKLMTGFCHFWWLAPVASHHFVTSGLVRSQKISCNKENGN